MLVSVARAVWPAAVGALAVVYAVAGNGAWARRSAIAWMMGSWGARLAVQSLYTRAMAAAITPNANTTVSSQAGGVESRTDVGSAIVPHTGDMPDAAALAAGVDGTADCAEARASARELAWLAFSAVLCSLPALLASFNRTPELFPIELVACAVWLVGFAGETTADRQRLRFVAASANRGRPCRVGLWRYSAHIDRIFRGLVWLAFALFAFAAL